VNYNLSPEERFKQKNIICFGIVPGPKKPSDFNSFLFPLVHQFQQLYTGINAIDASRQSENQHFLLRAYIVAIGADMPAKDMLMGLCGHSSRHYCNYCEARGIYSSRFRHIYAPVMPPVPSDPDWRRYDPNTLPIRNHHKSKVYAAHVEATGDTEIIQGTGIKSYTPFWDLPSVIFPWSYSIDSMHLFYMNIAPYMRDHWENNFSPRLDNGHEAYHISRTDWMDINDSIDSNDMAFPLAFGDKPRSISTIRKAAEWKTWVKVIHCNYLFESNKN
jgi:hypothetical protein